MSNAGYNLFFVVKKKSICLQATPSVLLKALLGENLDPLGKTINLVQACGRFAIGTVLKNRLF